MPALAPLAAALSLSVALAACGGGGGTGASGTSGSTSSTAAAVTMKGSAVDSPIAGAQITFTSGAPLGDTGATVIGTLTADGNGTFTANVNVPSTNTPIFANATDPNHPAVVLSSYLGQGTALAAAGTLSSSNLPDLDVSPVTTAALAVYAQLNASSYANLSASTYATTLSTYGGDILVIAAAIKAVGDNLCTPSTTISSTSNLAAAIAAGANLTSGSSTTLATAAAALGGNCATALASLPQTIESDSVFGPQLSFGDVIEAAAPAAAAGTYVLEGVIAESGFGANPSASEIANAPASVAPASVFTDTAVTVAGDGTVTSSDGHVSGTLHGNLLELSVTNGTQTYSVRGHLAGLPSSVVAGGSAYAIQSGGKNAGTNVPAMFSAVLAASGAAPVWNGIAVPTGSSDNDGVSCAAGEPLRLNGFIAGVGGGTFGECVVPAATGWAMSAPIAVNDAFDFDFEKKQTQNAVPTLTAAAWTEAGSAPFVLADTSASVSLGTSGTSPVAGTTYYVMGAHRIVFATSTGNSVLAAAENALMPSLDDAADH